LLKGKILENPQKIIQLFYQSLFNQINHIFKNELGGQNETYNMSVLVFNNHSSNHSHFTASLDFLVTSSNEEVWVSTFRNVFVVSDLNLSG